MITEDLDYINLEKILSKYAAKKSAADTTIQENKQPAEATAMKKIPIRNLLPENYTETVFETEKLILVHFFKDREFHKTFSEVFSKYK